jgi:hypothetical protein
MFWDKKYYGNFTIECPSYNAARQIREELEDDGDIEKLDISPTQAYSLKVITRPLNQIDAEGKRAQIYGFRDRRFREECTTNERNCRVYGDIIRGRSTTAREKKTAWTTFFVVLGTSFTGSSILTAFIEGASLATPLQEWAFTFLRVGILSVLIAISGALTAKQA